VAAVPNGYRARAFGVAQSGLLAAQGLGILAAGAAARWISPPTVVAIAGLLGMVAAALLASDWARHRCVFAELAGNRGCSAPGDRARNPGPGEASGPRAN
jgi:hypothetical protein